MNKNVTPEALTALENARRSNGQFGEQHHAEAPAPNLAAEPPTPAGEVRGQGSPYAFIDANATTAPSGLTVWRPDEIVASISSGAVTEAQVWTCRNVAGQRDYTHGFGDDGYGYKVLPGHVTLDEDAFDAQFGHIEDPAEQQFYWDDDRVRAAIADGTITEAQVWTAYDADDGGIVGTPGWGRVNAFARFVTAKEVPPTVSVDVIIQEGDSDADDEGGELDDTDEALWQKYNASNFWVRSPEDFATLPENWDRDDVDGYFGAVFSILDAVGEQAGDGRHVHLDWDAESAEYRIETPARNGLMISTPGLHIENTFTSAKPPQDGAESFRQVAHEMRRQRANLLKDAADMLP